ncbi:GNAT family N-acetyltransferase [Hahella sp. CR1]|uniref:GNAT family N-acetyltransferase n=1 Tax=Hahella sp. CR1 TaxID=2992807 RepID=UPI002442679F|nr:GNAT family N-acetyltransferase [Hahella sp. CR1]MDG9668709.1 GNAT family N-acetyltransferase [Hahella sp. CR1]
MDNQSTSSGINIVPVRHETIDKLLELIADYQHFYGIENPDGAKNKEFFTAILNNPQQGRQFLYLNPAEEVVGFITLYFSYSSVRAVENVVLNDLYVAPNHRGKGIGRELINFAYNWALKRDKYFSLVWETEKSNRNAQYLYDSIENHRKSEWIHYQVVC